MWVEVTSSSDLECAEVGLRNLLIMNADTTAALHPVRRTSRITVALLCLRNDNVTLIMEFYIGLH